jgi:hypothetical protein
MNTRSLTHDIRCRCNFPILVTSLCQPLHNIGLVTHKPQQSHNLLPTGADSPQHIALLTFFNDEHQLVNRVDFKLNALDERTKSIGDVIDKRVGNPVGCNAYVVFQLFDPAAHILRVWGRAEVELRKQSGNLSQPDLRPERGGGGCETEQQFTLQRTDNIPSRNTRMYMFKGSRCVGLYGS